MKKLVVFTLLFLVFTCSLQVAHSDPRQRVDLDKPAYGARIDRSHRLTESLTACFLFNERSGLRAYDLAHWEYANFHLYLQGGSSPNDPEWDGTVGWRFRSTGGGTWAVSSQDRVIRSTFTIALWVMPTSNVNAHFFNGETPEDSLYIIWYPQDGTFKGFAALAGALIASPTYATSKRVHEINKIYHVVVTADPFGSGNTKLYVNNELQNMGLAKGGPHNSRWRIGSYQLNTAPVDMVFYALYIWNDIVLTATDVEELYLSPYCIIEEELDGVGVWAAISEAAASQVIYVR